jgi:hypothetical protein
MTEVTIAIYLDLALCAGLGTFILYTFNDESTY